MTTARFFSPWFVILAAVPNLLNAQTSVALTVAPSSPSMLGLAVTLSASVTPAAATGKVTFYDGVNLVGTKPLTSGATSLSTILLTAGSHKLKAYYLGDTSNVAATSNTVSQTVAAQASAGFAVRTPVSITATSVLAVGDFNGDSKADLVIRTNGANGTSLSVLLGDGAGNFTSSFTLSVSGITPVAAAVGDFNGDGIPDLAVASSTSSNVTVLLGNGDGTFLMPASYPVPNSLQGIAVADFNGDGKADIATADSTTGVNILLGKGDGTFQAAVPYTVNQSGPGFQAAFVLVGDFNGDGKADVVTINANSSTLSVLLGTGTGTLQTPVITGIPSQAAQLALADFNADGKADLATNNGFVLLGKGDGTFQSAVSYPTGTGAPASVAAGDFNGDGNLDLAFSDGVVGVVPGKGDGTFQAPVTYPAAGTGASSVLVGDFNGDGKTDLAVVSGGALNLLLGTNVTVTPTAGTPQSTAIRTQFPTALQVTVKSGSTPVVGTVVTFSAPSGAIDDLHPSGSAGATLSSTTAMTDNNGVASVTATANSIAGSYTATATALGISASFSLTNLAGTGLTITASPTQPQSAPVGTAFPNPLQVTLKDSTGTPASGVSVTFSAPVTGASAVLSGQTVLTNSSGVASVTATANNTPGTYAVTATAGSLMATFLMTNVQATTVTLATSPNPSNLGSAASLTATITNPSATGNVTFYDGVAVLGTKSAASGTATLSTVLLSPGVHKLTAFYRDSVNSVVGTSNTITQTVKAAAGGAFITQAPISVTPAALSTAVADFNGDGIPDFAIPVVSGSPAVLIYLGKGDGTFLPSASYQVSGTTANAIVAGDFNGDGKPDLAVATFATTSGGQGNANVNVLLGNGDGTFAAAVPYAGGTNSIGALAVGDFNTDGRADLVLAYSASHGVSLLLGNGDGTFGQPIAYTTISMPMAVSDFNGDSKPDLALGNTSSLNVSSPFVVPGNGDGTAQTAIAFSLGGSAGITSLVAGDFNGDGKTDLAVGGLNSGAAATWILIGNGDGTFQTAVSYSLGAAVASGDFNGDGFLDLVVANTAGATVGILQGKGDGTFQTGPSVSAGATLAVTDFNGDGRNDLLTTNTSAGTVTVLLGATSVSFAVTATGGSGQSAPVGTQFALPLQATVLNNGIPLSGATVNFTAPQSGASATLSSVTAVTNSSGVASITATANSVAGNYMVTAAYQGVTATFSLTNTTFAFITATGGTPQSTAVGTAFASALQVTVKDGLGNPVSGTVVTYAAPSTGASAALSSGTATTNSSGVASVTATANSVIGSYAVTASVGNLTVTFALSNIAGPPASITATGGTPQTAVIGTAFPLPLQATVKDAGGNPVSGQTVVFAAPLTGPSAILASPTAMTNAAGVASVTATANQLVGSYNVVATIGGTTVNFVLTNITIATITATGGVVQSAMLNTAFPTALQATVKDNNGNPVSGVTVTFAAPVSGASAVLSNTTATTNASGAASVTATANGIAGSYLVTATVGNLSASFTLTNSSGPPASLTATGGTLQSALVDSAFAVPLQVTVKDVNGLPVVGATVVFSAPTVGASAVLSTTSAATNSAGVASITATANNIPGTYNVTASVSNLTTTFSLTNLLGGGSNLALGRNATQSSTYPGNVGASAAVDGNTDGAYTHGSVTATNADPNAWWQVDLGAPASINSVVVWNRTDCCGTRLSDFWVFVSNTPFLATDTPATLQNRAGTFASHQTTAPNPSTTINVGGAQGQYVRVQLSDTDYLSLAEVQVMGTGGAPAPSNLSLGKTASQSSTLPGVPSAAASSAVDGVTDGNFFDGSVTATNADPNAWWQVDLGASSTVNSVVVWNRTDCCGTRLSDYWVFVSDTPFLPNDTPSTLQNRAATFASHQTTAPNPSATITVNAQGRYVRVQLSFTDYLSLAEVQVMGIGPAVSNISKGKTATQSSTLPGVPTASAVSAVDGNTDGAFFDGSVTATNADPNAWWQVDLGAPATVNSVVVWNRTDCCATRLSDFWVFVSNTPFLSTDTPATLQNRAGTFASHQTTAPNPSTTITVGAQGRYVRVQLSDTDYLSLAEVQVFGVGGAPALNNVAQGKTATESSTLPGVPSAAASSAVDGNTDGAFYDGSVTATSLDPNPWWEVDLGSNPTVSSVVVWNRTDCCGSRLGDYWVFVSNTPFLDTDTPSTLQNRAGTFAIHQTTAPNPSTSIPVGMQGRYVRVQLSSAGYLSLAEVQVYGQ